MFYIFTTTVLTLPILFSRKTETYLRFNSFSPGPASMLLASSWDEVRTTESVYPIYLRKFIYRLGIPLHASLHIVHSQERRIPLGVSVFSGGRVFCCSALKHLRVHRFTPFIRIYVYFKMILLSPKAGTPVPTNLSHQYPRYLLQHWLSVVCTSSYNIKLPVPKSLLNNSLFFPSFFLPPPEF